MKRWGAERGSYKNTLCCKGSSTPYLRHRPESVIPQNNFVCQITPARKPVFGVPDARAVPHDAPPSQKMFCFWIHGLNWARTFCSVHFPRDLIFSAKRNLTPLSYSAMMSRAHNVKQLSSLLKCDVLNTVLRFILSVCVAEAIKACSGPFSVQARALLQCKW